MGIKYPSHTFYLYSIVNFVGSAAKRRKYQETIELEENHPEFVNTDDEGFKTVKYIDLLIAKIAELEARLEKAGL